MDALVPFALIGFGVTIAALVALALWRKPPRITPLDKEEDQ